MIGTAAQTVLVGLAHAFSNLSLSPIISHSTSAENTDTPAETETGLEDSDEEVVVAKKSRGNQLKRVLDDEEESHDEGMNLEQSETPIQVDSMEVVDSVVSEKKIPTSVPGLQFDSICDENLVEVINLIPVKPPPEAVKLNTSKKLPKDVRNELAVIAVKRAFSECPSLTVLSNSLLQNQNSLHELHKYCRLTPGVPVAPMLAKPTKKVAEVLKRLSGQLFTMEYKYDGERAQIHFLEDGTIKIFSRNSEDNTLKYPEFLDVIR